MHTDRMVNIWNAYQCMATFNLSRSASFYRVRHWPWPGFPRFQSGLARLRPMVPARARERILDLAATQLPTGGAYHQYQPLTKRGNNDIGSGFQRRPPLADLGVAAYIKETGDWTHPRRAGAVMTTPGPKQPLYEHLQRSFRYTLDRPARTAADRPRRLERLPQSELLLRHARRILPDHDQQGRQGGRIRLHRRFVRAAAQRTGRIAGSAARPMRRKYLAKRASMERRPPARLGRRMVPARLRRFRPQGWVKECEEGKIFIETQGFCTWPESASKTASPFGRSNPRARSRDQTWNCLAAARLFEVLSRTRRDLLLPARLQGKRRHLLPQQSVGHHRRNPCWQWRRGARLYRGSILRPAKGSATAPLRALRLFADDRWPRRANVWGGEELMAHRHGRLELLRHYAVDSGYPARTRRPAASRRFYRSAGPVFTPRACVAA